MVMFAYLSTVEHGLVDSAIRNRSSAFLLQCCAPFRCHLYKVIITFSLIGHEKIIQRIPITNVNGSYLVSVSSRVRQFVSNTLRTVQNEKSRCSDSLLRVANINSLFER